ncbi:MAG: hypothetical protein IT196_00010 [Acidimicrobiales bacterium]|nr:hypothetical protein [Acidimicrobiales bacterium]
MRIKHTITAIALGATLTGVGITAAATLPALAGAAQTQSAAPAEDPANGGRLLDALAPLVADGTLTQEQADAVAATLQDSVAQHRERRVERRAELVETAAQFLGISVEDLQARWSAGDTLADIAADSGRSREELTAALVDGIGTRADAAAANGTITVEQAARIKERAPQLVERLVDIPGGEHRGGSGGLGGRLRERLAD